MKLEGKVAIVTGSTAGIGKTTAILFAQEGAKVVISGRRADKGNEVVEEIKANGGEAIFVATDMAKEEDIDNLVQKTVEAFGKIDIVFNNAGIAFYSGLLDFDMAKWDEVFRLNLRGPVYLSKKAMPYLLETKGNILNCASSAGITVDVGGYAYNVSKAALNRTTQVMAVEFAPMGVRINAICPGMTQTDILSVLDDERMAEVCAGIPLGYVCDPIDIARAALFIVSDDARYMTGQIVAVEGGLTLSH